MFFLILFLNVLLFFVHLMVEDSLKLSFEILLAPELSFVVNLWSYFSNLDTFFNEFVLELIPLLERTDILALDILLVVHDHLIVLKKMKDKLHSYTTTPWSFRPHAPSLASHYRAFVILTVSFFLRTCTGSYVALLSPVAVGRNFCIGAILWVSEERIVGCDYGVINKEYLNY